MNYIFLDVDGVLNSKDTNDRVGKIIGVEDAKIDVLRQILDTCGYPKNARLILSSSWRYGWDDPDDNLCEYLRNKLLQDNIVVHDVTPILDVFHRGYEIMRYLVDTADFNAESDSFIIIDDEMFDYEDANIDDRLIKTSFYEPNGGLRYVSVIKSRALCIMPPKQKITKRYVDDYMSYKNGWSIHVDLNHSGRSLRPADVPIVT